jgi:hypothetical protein
MRYSLLIFLFLFLISGCTSTSSKNQKKKAELISQSVYATSDSIKAQRYDLASKYSEESTKLILAPQKRIKIEQISFRRIDPETRLEVRENRIILPESDIGSTIRLNSQEYFELLKQKEVARAFADGEKVWKQYSTEVEAQKRAEIAEKEKLAKELEKEKNRGIGIFDMIHYIGIALLSIPLFLVIIVLVWLGSIVFKVLKSK